METHRCSTSCTVRAIAALGILTYRLLEISPRLYVCGWVLTELDPVGQGGPLVLAGAEESFGFPMSAFGISTVFGISPVSAQMYHAMRATPIAPDVGTWVLPIVESMAATSLALMVGKEMSNSIGPPGAETRFANSYAQDSAPSLFIILILAPVPHTSAARASNLVMRAGENVTLTSPGFRPSPAAEAVDAIAPTLVVTMDNVADGVAGFILGATSCVRYSVLTPIHY